MAGIEARTLGYEVSDDNQRVWVHVEMDRPVDGWNRLGIHALQVRLTGATFYSSKESNHGFIGTIPFDYVQTVAPHRKAYEEWVRDLEKSLGLEPNSAPAKADTDSDGDGLEDLSEFSLGSNPRSGNEPYPLQTGVVEEGDATYLTLSFTQSVNVSGIVWTLQGSSDGVEWKAVDELFEVIEQDTLDPSLERLVLRSRDPLTDLDMNLFRVATRVLGTVE